MLPAKAEMIIEKLKPIGRNIKMKFKIERKK